MKKTPLHALHIEQKAQMAEFAGYDMPIQYPNGVLTEHKHVREKAGIFDVSHMGQLSFDGVDVQKFLERMTPSSYNALKPNGCKYSVLTNEDGGIVDDLIITKINDTKFTAVVNGACKDKDVAWFEQHLPQDIMITRHEDRALIALQGPKAEQVLRETLEIDASDMSYMTFMEAGEFGIYRLGYTGEDGFEISVPDKQAPLIWQKLLDHADVEPIGLAARDSLRLEMGYPLYGHDIDATTSPVEAGLSWVMGKQTNTGFIGADRVLNELKNGTNKVRIGFELVDRGVAREGVELFDENDNQIGVITSGTFSPSLQKAIGMAYVETEHANIDNIVNAKVRGRNIKAQLKAYPFLKASTKQTIRKAA